MDFDEYEYLEKTVEDPEDQDGSKKKNRAGTTGKSERSYRKRDADVNIDNVDEERRRSKRSRDDGDERRDKDRHKSSRDRDRERESERGRDRDRDGERKRGGREKEREREKEKERGIRDKDRDKQKERRERDSEREREREKREKSNREREKAGDRKREDERERSRRSRSRSSRRHGSVEKEREREVELREGEREIEMKDHRRFKDKKETLEPEVDPERDQRTVFAYQMPLKAAYWDVYEFFSKAGKVRDVKLIMDRNSNRSKGVGNAILMRNDGNTLHSCLINSCCALKASESPKETQLELSALEYIEFYDAMSVPMAIALSGQLLLGQPVMVKPSEAEKNLVQSNASGGIAVAASGPYGAVDRKLYVGNLHFNMTEIQLRQIFEPFGTVELVQLPLDLETGHCKGFGFVQFAQLESAKSAQSALNGQLEIVGRVIKVSSVTDHVGTQDIAAKSADFDDDDGGGLSLNAQSRAMLMQKLDRTGVASSIAGSLGVPVLNGIAPSQQPVSLHINGQASTPVLPAQLFPSPVSEPIGLPSECLLLKNMFDPATETEPDFHLGIQDDVEEECSKYGRVKHIYVDKHSAGFVYLRFETAEASANAQRAMHMRWFAQKLISAIFMPRDEYEAKFSG